MRVLVVGGTGLVGRGVVAALTDAGHEVRSASRSTGVDTRTGAGLEAAASGVEVVVDVSNPPPTEDPVDFFTGSTTNLLDAGRAAKVRHHLVLSVAGVDGLTESPYLAAKLAQEELVAGSGAPYTILRATQFFEFLPVIADVATDADRVRLPPVQLQPIAVDAVVAVVARLAVAQPLTGCRELGGPEPWRLDLLVAEELRRRGDGRDVVRDPAARYFGARLGTTSLLPSPTAERAGPTYRDWATNRGSD